MLFVIALIAAYCAGSIPSALSIGKLVRGLDVREHGSGNMGAANAARVLGARWGILVGLVDIAKGFAPVAFLAAMAARSGPLDLPETQILIGVTAVLGHLFPLFAGFKGGKGVLTMLGVFLALLPFESGVALAVWIAVFAVTRIVSAGSLAAVVAFTTTGLLRRFVFDVPIPDALLILAIVVMPLLFYTHRSNLRRLLAGTENRFGGRAGPVD